MTAEPVKDWREKRQRRQIITSATQHETFDLCKRKWWLNKVRKLFVPTSESQAFGTVLHAVCERFLNADDLGRDSKGNPVELYPEGWHIARSRFSEDGEAGAIEGEVTLQEQDLIKRLVAKAIEEGVLERRPGRQIERQFNATLISEPHTVSIMGFVDLLYSDQVEDHKTAKSMKWAKSQEALKKALPMLTYAKFLVEDLKKRGGAVPSQITLRHNVYCKDPAKPVVRKTEAQVSMAEIEANWKHMQENAVEMIRLRDTAEIWSDVADPVNPSKSCNAYGGCPFVPICGGMESELGYENRLAKYCKTATLAVLETHHIQDQVKGSDMNAFEAKLAAKVAAQKAAGANVPPPSVNPPSPQPPQIPSAVFPQPGQPATVPAPVSQPAPAMDDVFTPPPWAFPGCGGCNGGTGFNSKGNPCKICVSKAGVQNRPTPDMFTIEAIGNGVVVWVGKPGTPAAGLEGQSVVAVANPVQAQDHTAPPAAAPAPVAPPAPVATTSPVSIPTPVAPPVALVPPVQEQPEETASPGRPKKGFCLLINCGAIKGIGRKGSGRSVTYLSDVLFDLQTDMAKHAGVSSYFELDAFARRDALAKAAPMIVDSFGADMVVVTGLSSGQSDMRTLVDAIRPYAGMEIIAEG